MLSIKNTKPFGLLVPTKFKGCSESCDLQVRFEDQQNAIPIDDGAEICWTVGRSCVSGEEKKCGIFEIAFSIVLKLKDYDVEYETRKLSYQIDSLKNKNYSNTRFDEVDLVNQHKLLHAGLIYRTPSESVEMSLETLPQSR